MKKIYSLITSNTWIEMIFGYNSVATTIRLALLIGTFCIIFSTLFWWLRLQLS